MKLYIIALIALSGCCFFIGWENKPEPRTFFVGFTGTTQNGQTYSGGMDIVTPLGQFPSIKILREYIGGEMDLKSTYIVSIYEFTSENDRKKFWSK